MIGDRRQYPDHELHKHVPCDSQNSQLAQPQIESRGLLQSCFGTMEPWLFCGLLASIAE